ncbi:MAG: hypothetical protein SPJ36_04905 [Peptostreptococcus porci]|nr:hypothetical protein [Peptostreptococcus porci]
MSIHKKSICLLIMIVVLGICFSIDSQAVTQTRLGALLQGTMTFDRNSSGYVSNARNIVVKENKYAKWTYAYRCLSKKPIKYNGGKYYKIDARGVMHEITSDKYAYNEVITGFH